MYIQLQCPLSIYFTLKHSVNLQSHREKIFIFMHFPLKPLCEDTFINTMEASLVICKASHILETSVTEIQQLVGLPVSQMQKHSFNFGRDSVFNTMQPRHF